MVKRFLIGLFFVTSCPSFADVLEFPLRPYFYYRETGGVACFMEVKPPVYTLRVEVNGSKIISALMLGRIERRWLSAQEVGSLSLQVDATGKKWLKRIYLSPSLLHWVLATASNCMDYYQKLGSTTPVVVLNFEEVAQGQPQRVYAPRFHFGGIGTFGRPYKANILLEQSRQ